MPSRQSHIPNPNQPLPQPHKPQQQQQQQQPQQQQQNDQPLGPLDDAFKFFVANMDFDTTALQIKSFFSVFGVVNFVKLIMDTRNNRSKGYGFLYMLDSLGDAAVDSFATAHQNRITMLGKDRVFLARHDHNRAQPLRNPTRQGHDGDIAKITRPSFDPSSRGGDSLPAGANSYGQQPVMPNHFHAGTDTYSSYAPDSYTPYANAYPMPSSQSVPNAPGPPTSFPYPQSMQPQLMPEQSSYFQQHQSYPPQPATGGYADYDYSQGAYNGGGYPVQPEYAPQPQPTGYNFSSQPAYSNQLQHPPMPPPSSQYSQDAFSGQLQYSNIPLQSQSFSHPQLPLVGPHANAPPPPTNNQYSPYSGMSVGVPPQSQPGSQYPENAHYSTYTPAHHPSPHSSYSSQPSSTRPHVGLEPTKVLIQNLPPDLPTKEIAKLLSRHNLAFRACSVSHDGAQVDLGSTADAANLLTLAQQGRLVWNDRVLTASLQQVQSHRSTHNRQRPFPSTNPGGRGPPPDRSGRGGGPSRGGPHRDKMGRGRSDRNMRRERPY